MRLAYPIDWPEKLRRGVHALAFVLVVSAVQAVLRVDTPYGVTLIYSTCIGMLVWVLVDFGRHHYPSARARGWPTGWAVWVHLMGSVSLAFLVGVSLADWLCGWPWATFAPGNRAELRSSLTITLVCSAAASYYFHTRHSSREMRQAVQQANSQAAEARLKLLQTQLQPHMMFNTLANLRAMIPLDPVGSQQMLDHLIAYLRATLGGSRASQHPLADEFERLRDYLALMAVRMGPRLGVRLDLPPELAQLPVPTLLLQPLVENAIQHGLEPSVPGGTLAVSAQREARPGGDWLVLRVADDGVGVVLPLAPPAHRGFGLVQVHERLGTLYGEQGSAPHPPPGQWCMDISHADAAHARGTVVTLRIPLTSTSLA